MKDVEHTPDRWTGGTCPGGPGARSDEILFHELVHVVRARSGEASRRQLTGNMAGYNNEEEFFAILITNLYISETGGTLRQDHRTFSQLAAGWSTSAGFLGVLEKKALIAKIMLQNPTWMSELAGMKQLKFNPLREYVLNHEPADRKFMRQWKS